MSTGSRKRLRPSEIASTMPTDSVSARQPQAAASSSAAMGDTCHTYTRHTTPENISSLNEYISKQFAAFLSQLNELRADLLTKTATIDAQQTEIASLRAALSALQRDIIPNISRAVEDTTASMSKLPLLERQIHDTLECTARIPVLEQQLHETVEQVQKVPSLEQDVRETKSWASILKSSTTSSSSVAPSLDTTVQGVLAEQQRRDDKKLNLRFRGLPTEGTALDQVTSLFTSRMGLSVPGIQYAWRLQHDPKVLFVKFKTMDDRQTVLRARRTLRGSQIYIDDDLTHCQWLQRKTIIQEARTKQQRVVFTNGNPRFFSKRQ